MPKLRLPERHLAAIVCAGFAVAVACSANVSAPLTDNFHEGEFLGLFWHLRDYSLGLAGFPLLVHGAMDYLPAQLAVKLFGFGQAIVGTHLLLMLLTALQYFLLLHTATLLIGNRAQRGIWIFLILLYFYLVAPPFDAPVIEASYFPVRDLFLSLTLWSLVNYVLARTDRRRYAFLTVGATAAGCACFWCYNRGLIALALLGIFWLGLVVRRRFGGAVLLPSVLLATLSLLDRLRLCGTIRENAGNIGYWLRYGAEVNHLRFKPEYLTGLAGLAALCLLATAVLILALASRHRRVLADNDLLIFLVVGLFVVQALQIQIVFGVADLEYALHGAWPSILLLLVYAPRLLVVDSAALLPRWPALGWSGAHLDHRVRLAAQATGAAMLLFLVVCHHHVFVPYARFAKNLIRPIANEQILSPDIVALSDLVKATPDACYFNWANDDVVAFLAGKRLCTDYPYVHYVAPSLDQNLLAQLRQARLSLIVLDEDFWPFTRHREPMAERLPVTARYIAENYRRQTTLGHFRVVFSGP